MGHMPIPNKRDPIIQPKLRYSSCVFQKSTFINRIPIQSIVFLTKDSDIEKYKNLVNVNVNGNGYFILATFADNGPDQCSGLFVSKYSKKEQAVTFKDYFTSLDSFNYEHSTPFGTTQNFTFSVFNKNNN